VVASEYLPRVGEHEQARAELRQLLQRAAELGDGSSPPLLLVPLGHIECELGELQSALRCALEGREAAEQAGQRNVIVHNLAVESLVDAFSGRSDGARATAERSLELSSESGARGAELVATEALGHLELTLGAMDAARARLDPIVTFVREQAIGEPCAIRFVVDQVEALIELGRPEEAVELLDWYEGDARRLCAVSALANCARCRGMLGAQEGDLGGALQAYEDALALHKQVELPLDHGRTLLALGVAQRRLKRRRDSRETLDEALALFERM